MFAESYVIKSSSSWRVELVGCLCRSRARSSKWSSRESRHSCKTCMLFKRLPHCGLWTLKLSKAVSKLGKSSGNIFPLVQLYLCEARKGQSKLLTVFGLDVWVVGYEYHNLGGMNWKSILNGYAFHLEYHQFELKIHVCHGLVHEHAFWKFFILGKCILTHLMFAELYHVEGSLGDVSFVFSIVQHHQL